MYCCDRFKVGCEQKKRTWPNIRVVKCTSEFLFKDSKGVAVTQEGKSTKVIRKSNCSYRYFIAFTIGDFKFSSPEFILVNFCPYCGQNLYEYYNKDEFVNEMEGKDFYL